jgi:hypothetical protein
MVSNLEYLMSMLKYTRKCFQIYAIRLNNLCILKVLTAIVFVCAQNVIDNMYKSNTIIFSKKKNDS